MTPPEAAVLLRALADRLDANSGSEFGGAFIIIPPGEQPDVIDSVFITTTPNPAVFWSSVSGQVELASARLAQTAQQGWRR